MRELNNLKIIATDLGYGNIKTAGTVTPTGIKVIDYPPLFNGTVLELDGKYYCIGEGHKEFLADKWQDKDFYLLNLMGIAKELHREHLTQADVHLVTSVPLTWVHRQKEPFRKYLIQNQQVDFKMNGTDYHICLKGCSIYPQGYPAIVERLHEFKGTNLLADIGNGTMNILFINNKKPIESKCYTEKIGVEQCVIASRNAVMNELQVKIDDAIINQVLRFGTADIKPVYVDCIANAASVYVESLFATLRRYEYNPDLMRLYIVGGGGCLVKHFGKYDKERVTIIDDICATAKGCEYLAYHALRRKEQL